MGITTLNDSCSEHRTSGATTPALGQSTTLAPVWGLFVTSVRDLRRAAPQFLRFGLLFEVLAYSLLGPILAAVFRRVATTNGSGALGNADIVRAMLTPLGLSALSLCALLLCTITFTRLSGFLWIGYGTSAGQQRDWLETLRFVARRSPRVLSVSCVLLTVSIFTITPFILAAVIVAKRFLGEHDINFYLDAHPPEFLIAVGIGAGLGVLAVIVLAIVVGPLIFLLPHALLRDMAIRMAIRQSREMARAIGFRRIVAAILIWVCGWLGTAIVLNAVLQLIGRYAVTAVGERGVPLLIVLGTLAAASLIVNFCIGLISTACGCKVCVRLYRQACEQLGMEAIPASANSAASTEPSRLLSLRWRIVLTASVLLVIAVLATAEIVETTNLVDRVEISAHRGASLEAPENTLSAVLKGIEIGADYVEIDVQRTTDGVVVVNHDSDLMRVAGSPLVIARSTFNDLQRIDVGSRFSPAFDGERIATLEQVLEQVDGRAKVIVELKTYGAEAGPLIRDVVRMIRERGLVSQVVIMSLEYREVQEVRRVAPEIECGLIVSVSVGNISRLEADFLAIAKSKATQTLIATAHAHGKRVFVWTVDNPDEMSTLIDRGVDNLITNDPAAAVALLKERASLGGIARLLLRFRSLYE